MRAVLLAALPFVAALSCAAAAAPLTLSHTEPDGRAVMFRFAENRTGPGALVIETRRVGNPGARLSIWIDRNPSRLVARILQPEDCAFDDGGARCVLRIDGGSPAYGRFVQAFKAGRTVHVAVENASLMEMSADLSLIGFTRAYGR